MTRENMLCGHVLLWPLNGDVLGDAVPILDGVSTPSAGTFRFPRYSISRNGTLTYGTGGGTSGAGRRRLVVVDLDGNEEVSDLASRSILQVRWSPDGRSVAYVSVAEGDLDSDIFTYDMALETTPRRVTFEGINSTMAYSPDGTRIVFSSFRGGTTDGWDLFVKSLGDDTPARSVATLPGDELVVEWPSENLIVWEQRPQPSDLWMVDLSDPENPRAEEYLSSEADLDAIVISPDGTLAAYHSNQSGRDEVYLRSFPEPREPTLVS